MTAMASITASQTVVASAGLLARRIGKHIYGIASVALIKDFWLS